MASNFAANFPTEESFVRATFCEFVNMWGNGSQAHIQVQCYEGQAWVQLMSALGPPSSPHLFKQHDLHHHHRHGYHGHHPGQHRRRKGAKKRDRDRARAALHRASLLEAAAAQETLHHANLPPDIPQVGQALFPRADYAADAAAASAEHPATGCHSPPRAHKAGPPPHPPADIVGHLTQGAASKACNPRDKPAEREHHAPPPYPASQPTVPPLPSPPHNCHTPGLEKKSKRKRITPTKYQTHHSLTSNKHLVRRGGNCDVGREDSDCDYSDKGSEVPCPVFLDAPPKGQQGAPHPGHGGLPLLGKPHDGWSPGELPAEEQIAAMSYEELVSFAGGGDWKKKRLSSDKSV